MPGYCQPPAVQRQRITSRLRLLDISKNNLRIFAKFIAETPYMIPPKRLTFGAGHVQDG